MQHDNRFRPPRDNHWKKSCGLDRVDVIFIGAVPGDHLAIPGCCVEDTDRRRRECPGLDRDPACLPEQLVTTADSHDKRTDGSQHRMQAIDTPDPVLRFVEIACIEWMSHARSLDFGADGELSATIPMSGGDCTRRLSTATS